MLGPCLCFLYKLRLRSCRLWPGRCGKGCRFRLLLLRLLLLSLVPLLTLLTLLTLLLLTLLLLTLLLLLLLLELIRKRLTEKG